MMMMLMMKMMMMMTIMLLCANTIKPTKTKMTNRKPAPLTSTMTDLFTTVDITNATTIRNTISSSSITTFLNNREFVDVLSSVE